MVSVNYIVPSYHYYYDGVLMVLQFHILSGQNTGVGSLSLFQGIFLTQESNQGLLHCRRIFYQLSYQGSPQRNFPEIELCIAWEIQ